MYLRYLIKKIHQILQCRLYLNLVSEMVHIKAQVIKLTLDINIKTTVGEKCYDILYDGHERP